MWTKLNATMQKHGFHKLNSKGFVADIRQDTWTNYNVVKIVYGFRDPIVKMVDTKVNMLDSIVK
jgi:hypothetical protein